MAIAALVLGIVGAVFAFIPGVNLIGIIIAIVGLILGIIALVQSKKNNGEGKGKAIAGVVLSAVAVVITVVMYIIVAAAANAIVQKGLQEAGYESMEDFSEDLQNALESAGVEVE